MDTLLAPLFKVGHRQLHLHQPRRAFYDERAGIHCRRDASDHRTVGEVNGISAPQSRKVTDPLPGGNADPLDRSLAMGLPPSGNWGRPLTGFRRTPRANVVRCHTPRLRPLLDPDPLEFLFALASLEVG